MSLTLVLVYKSFSPPLHWKSQKILSSIEQPSGMLYQYIIRDTISGVLAAWFLGLLSYDPILIFKMLTNFCTHSNISQETTHLQSDIMNSSSLVTTACPLEKRQDTIRLEAYVSY